MKRIAAFGLVALLASSCATLGREYPRCDSPFTDIPISIIMEIQAIPDAQFGPCLYELEPGWTYHHMQHQTGEVTFWLDSDRVGDHFVKVTLTEACDPGSAAGRRHPNEAIKRFVEATEEIQPVDIVIMPTAGAALDYAAKVGVELSGVSVRGRPFRLRLDESASSFAGDKIAAALNGGAFVIVVDDVDQRQGTMQVRSPEGERAFGLTLADAIEEIEHRVEAGSYRATWFHLFDGGCVTFEFDAEGNGVESLVSDIERAVGFVDLASLQAQAEEAGFILDESELDE